MTFPRGVQPFAPHLSPLEFDALLRAHGSPVEYRPAIACPCVRIDTRMPAGTCPTCKGLGRVYPEALRKQVTVLDTQRSATLRLERAGLAAQGTIQLTFPVGVIPALGDMVLPCGDVHIVQETLFRDGTRRVTDAMIRDARRAPDHLPVAQRERTERLLYPGISCIELASYINADGAFVMATEAQYTIDADSRWTWKEGFGPAPGAAWTVRYRAPAAYVVYTSSPMFRHEGGGGPMPYRVQAQRLDKVSAEDLR